MITLQPITEENFLAAASLRVSVSQSDYVAPASHVLARAYAYRNQRSICWAIYYDTNMVGLAMIHDIEEDPACYHLAEFLIDEQYQNCGYGQQALKLIVDYCRKEGRFSAMEVCVKRSNIAAIHVYTKEGFLDTGYMDPATPESLCMIYDLQKNISEINYKNILLRDRTEKDIEDWVRWNTVETEWMDWDGPDIPSEPFDEAAFRQNMYHALKTGKKGLRRSFEIDNAEGIHLGQVNTYRINSNWEYLDDYQDPCGIGTAIGVGICESIFWNKGYGSQALVAFVRYLLEQGETNLYLQTWSGNIRMVRVAQKIGFVECNRFIGNRLIREGIYDGLTFKLDLTGFTKYLSENP